MTRAPALMAATFFAARVVAHEEIARPLREAVPEGRAAYLVRCSRCVGPWAAVGLLAADRTGPGRVAVDALALAGANAFLQSAFTGLCRWANR